MWITLSVENGPIARFNMSHVTHYMRHDTQKGSTLYFDFLDNNGHPKKTLVNEPPERIAELVEAEQQRLANLGVGSWIRT